MAHLLNNQGLQQQQQQQQQKQETMAMAMEMAMESSVEAAVRDCNVVAHIVRRLLSAQDRVSAALVCRIWNHAVTSESRRLAIRSRSLLPHLANRFRHIVILDLSHCSNQLENQDIALAASSFPRLHTLIFGHPDLPQEKVTDEGFRYLARSCENLKHITLCCLPHVKDAGIFLVAKSCKLLKSISLENCRGLTDQALEAISTCRNLEEISLKGLFKFTPLGLAFIGEGCLRLLRVRLELGPLDISPVLKSLAIGCLIIQEISLKARNVDLKDLVRCSTLTCLRVETDERSHMVDVLIAIATTNKNLKELVVVNHFVPLDDAAVGGIIQKCHKLEKLHIESVKLTEVSLLCLMGCKTLRSLALNHFKSVGQGLAEIGLCGLKLIDFSLRSGRGIRDVELQTLMQGNQSLQHLDLQCCHGPSAIGFSAIGACSNLLSLDLGFTHVDDVSLMAISNGTKLLRRLSLVKCEAIIDAGVISRFTSLESLNIDQCPFVSDSGLDSVARGCSSLAHLSVAFTKITDKGLFNLTKCSQLRSLRIPYCKGVQGPGIIAIANACTWFQYVALSHRFRGTKTLDELRKQCCMVRLEMDDMALVPFGFNLLI